MSIECMVLHYLHKLLNQAPMVNFQVYFQIYFILNNKDKNNLELNLFYVYVIITLEEIFKNEFSVKRFKCILEDYDVYRQTVLLHGNVSGILINRIQLYLFPNTNQKPSFAFLQQAEIRNSSCINSLLYIVQRQVVGRASILKKHYLILSLFLLAKRTRTPQLFFFY